MCLEERRLSNEPLLVHHFINFSPDPAFVIDMYGRVKVWNRAIELLTGVKAIDIIGQGNYAHSHAIYKKRIPILADIMLHPELEADAGYEQIRWDENGSQAESENESQALARFLWARASLLVNDAGEAAGVLETIRDITKIKQAEQIIFDNEIRLRRLNENMSDIICEVDLEGAYQYAGDSCRKIIGFEPAELYGQIFNEFVHPDDRKSTFKCYQQVLQHQEHPPLVFRHQHRDGHYVWLEGVVAPIIDSDGAVSGIVASLRDYSDRMETELRMRLAETVFSNMKEGIMVTDSDGRILDVNAFACHILGYDYQEIIGTNMMDYSARRQRIEGEERWQKLKEMQGLWRGNVDVATRNGDTITVGASTFRVKHDPLGEEIFVIVFEDCTEQLHLRQEQEALKEQMARVKRMASLSAMSAGIVHEIAQPLNAIKLVADGLLYWQKRGRVFEADQVMEKVSIISQQVVRIGGIIDHIRSFAGMNQSRDFKPFLVNDAVEGAMHIIGQQLANHEIDVVMELAHDIPAVMGDQHRFEEVVVNLLVNALHELDECSIDHKKIICKSLVKRNHVLLIIRDNGRGIPEASLEKIFEPFYSTKVNSRNMGLGLAIVQSVIASFNGNITAENHPKGGAVFTIDLPACKKVREKKS